MSTTDAGGSFGEPRSTSDPAGSAREMAADAAQTVKQEAASFAASAKDSATEKLEQHKQTASRTLGDFANAVRRAGDELAGADQSMATRVVRQAADGLEGLARSVENKRPEELLDAVRDFGRRNPTAFIAGSVLAGIALGRFLKSSAAPETMSAPARFSSPDGGAPELGMGQNRAAAPDLPKVTAPGGAPAAGLAGDLTAAGATSIGAPAAELGGESAAPEDLELAADVGGVPIDDLADDNLDREDIGDSGATDADRARFRPGA